MNLGYLLPTRAVIAQGATVADDYFATLTQQAEDAFDSVWVGDSVLAKPRHDPLIILSNVAAVTDMNLGTAIYLPTLRHPVIAAHQIGTVALLQSGPLKIGVGIGKGNDVRAEYETLNLNYSRRGAMLDEALEIMTRLWNGESVSFSGEFYTISNANIGFSLEKPPQIYAASLGFDPRNGIPAPIEARVEKYGGWIPGGISPEAYEAGLDDLHATHQGMYLDVALEADDQEVLSFFEGYYPDPPDELVAGVIRDKTEFADRIRAFDNAGAEYVVLRITAFDQRPELQILEEVINNHI